MEKEFRNITEVENRARNIRIQNGLTQKEFGQILGYLKVMFRILKMVIQDYLLNILILYVMSIRFLLIIC